MSGLACVPIKLYLKTPAFRSPIISMCHELVIFVPLPQLYSNGRAMPSSADPGLESPGLINTKALVYALGSFVVVLALHWLKQSHTA